MSSLDGPRNNLSINTQFRDEGGATNEDGFFSMAAKMISDTISHPSPSASSGPSKPSWGKTIVKHKFLDIGMLECGEAREYITEECLSPTITETEWKKTYVERHEKKMFKMYEEGTDRFLLSAKQVDSSFYISQYEDFPLIDGCPENYFCAVLRKIDGTNNFKLYNCGCEGCDGTNYTCNDHHEHHADDLDHFGESSTMEGADRQLLADITHRTKRIQHCDADMRSLKVIIPAVLEDKRSRVVWCPRINGTDTPTGGTPRHNKDKPLSFSSPTTRSPHFFNQQQPPLGTDRITMESKLPQWSPDLQSLVLKFHGGRISSASSKNFLLTPNENPEQDMMQFGKYSKGRFALDFRFPMAPVQAFGIALSSCAWSAHLPNSK